jgi:hypothetical protein
MGNPKHSLHLSESQSIPILPLNFKSHTSQLILKNMGKIPLKVHVVFQHLQCSMLDVRHDGASLSSGDLEKIHGKHFLRFRTPTSKEFLKMGLPANHKTGCTVHGRMNVPRVGGQLSIVMNRKTWREATMALMMGLRGNNRSGRTMDLMSKFNVSHYVEHVRFGLSGSRGVDNPLEGRAHVIDNHYGGMALEEIDVKLIPTKQAGFFMDQQSYQLSVVDHTVHPETMMDSSISQYPGISISYDFTPLAVHYSSGRESFLVFLSSLLSIVGGVFVTVSLLTGCLVHSAQAVAAKKID